MSLALTGAGPSAPGGGYLIEAYFTGTNETLLTNYTPDRDVVGNGFQSGAGVFDIVDNEAELHSGGGAVNNILIDAGVPNGTLNCDAKQAGVGAGVIFRASATNSALEAYGYPTDGKVYLIKNDGGARSVLASAAAGIQANGTYTFTVVLTGSSIVISVDTVEKINTTEAFNLNETSVGLWCWAQYAYRWDNLTMEA